MSVFCPKCGTENNESRYYCSNCGESLKKEGPKAESETWQSPAKNQQEPKAWVPPTPQPPQEPKPWTPPAPGSQPVQPAPSTYKPYSPSSVSGSSYGSSQSNTFGSMGPAKPSAAFAQKYGVLRGISNFCNVLAIIFAVIGGIGGLVGLFMLFSRGSLGLPIILGSAIFAVSGYIAYKLIGEAIMVLVDIEMNTRQSAAHAQALINLLGRK